jgi:hypothetical protein
MCELISIFSRKMQGIIYQADFLQVQSPTGGMEELKAGNSQQRVPRNK